MTSIRMAISELRRITGGKLPLLAVIALVLVPVIYAGLYLYANADPYSRLENVPAALVVEDRGATDSTGTYRNVGEQVAENLEDSSSFQWHRVAADDAEEGVRDNRYTFALTLPADFTSALQSSGNFTPRQGSLVLTTNDANNYLARTIATTLTTKVHDSVASQVGSQAADKLLTGFSTIHDQTVKAADGATQLAAGADQAHAGAIRLSSGAGRLADGQRQLLDGATRLSSGAGQLADGTDKLDAGASRLATGLNTLRDKTAELPDQTRKLAAGARQIADGNAELAAAGNRVAAAADKLAGDLGSADGRLAADLTAAGLTDEQVRQALTVFARLTAPVEQGNQQIQTLNTRLTTLGNGSAKLADGARQLADAAPALTDGIAQAATGADSLRTGAADLNTGAIQLRDGADTLATGEQSAVAGTDELATGSNQLASGTGQLATGAAQLRDGLNSGIGQIPDLDPSTRQATATTIGDPVAVRDIAQTTAGTYGAGLAPFFMALATWIGGYVLFLLVRPLSQRAMAANQTPLRVALGGWIPPALLGLAQITAMYLVVTLALGIRPEHPLGTWGLLALASLTFTAIVHALNAALGSIGQFLGLVLMVLQLVSAGGTFPWQTIPAPLYPLHYLLPMGYAIDGLRHLIYGGALDVLTLDVPVLCAWLLAAVLLTARTARRQRIWTASRVKPELVL